MCVYIIWERRVTERTSNDRASGGRAEIVTRFVIFVLSVPAGAIYRSSC